MTTRPVAVTRAEWPADPTPALAESTVAELLREQAHRHPDVVALVATTHAGEHRHWTYAALLAAARHTCGSLLSVADPGDHVALWAPNIAEWPIVQYAAALAGVTLVVLDPTLSPAELDTCLRLSRASVLIHADDHDRARIVAQVTPTIPDLLEVISFADVGRLYGSPVEPDELSAPDAPAMIHFTSAHRRAVLHSHQSLVDNARLTMLVAGAEPGASVVAALPASDPGGCILAHLGAAVLGGTLVLIEDPGPASLPPNGDVLPTTGSVLVSTHAIAATMPAAARFDTVLLGPTPIPAAAIPALQQAFGATVHAFSGRPELAAATFLRRLADPADVGIGRPLPHLAVRILDPTDGRIAPLDVVGEICARGHNQMIGYVDDPASTAAVVDTEGWLHTGELGSMDEQGMITPAVSGA